MPMDDNDVREEMEYLDEVILDYSTMVKNIGKNGLAASLLMNYRDEIQDIMTELALNNRDIREYRKKVVMLDNELRQKAQAYVNEVGHANFKQYQIINNPPLERWWWYLNKVTMGREEDKRNLGSFGSEKDIFFIYLYFVYFCVYTGLF